MKKRLSFSITAFIFIFNCYGQYIENKKKYEDKLAKSKEDTSRIKYLNKLSRFTQHNNFIESYNYAKQALELSEKLNFLPGKIAAFNNFGDAYWYHTDFVTAQKYYFKAYKINDSINDKRGIARSLYNIGWIICLQQKNFKEVGYLYQSLKIYEELKDTEGILQACNALGNFYSTLHLTTKLKMDFDSALHYYNLEMDFCKATPGYEKEYGIYYGNLADLQAQQGDYESAKFYSEKHVSFMKNSGDSARYYSSLCNLAEIEFKLGAIDKSIVFFTMSRNYAEKNDLRDIKADTYRGLYQGYQAKGNILKAFENYKIFIALSDSSDKNLFSSNLNDIQNSFEIEKREASIKELKQSNEIHFLKEERNKFLLIGAIIVLLIIIFIAYLLFRQNQQKNIVNSQLKIQNAIIYEKKKEIDNSINYAKGIQNAVLSEEKELKKHFPESFIFYRPKDVVSGDFYCFHESGDYFYCIAADCTGHGVPGALMSIVSMDKINQAIYEKKITEPSEILKYLNVQIKQALKQHSDESKQKDGLDIALLRFSKEKNTVTFAGANRPLFILNKGIFNEYKSDKVAIAGFTPDNHQFSQQKIELQKGSCLYIFSDGYSDQFGGSQGKKFMTKNFKTLIQSISLKSSIEQEKEITQSHAQWRGNYEQVDDILVIGLKI